MEPSRQSLSAYHRNQIDETGDGGFRNGLPGAFPWFGQLFTVGRLEQDGPYDGPDWGFFSSP